MKLTVGELRKIICEVLEDDAEEQIEELQASPEFKNLDSFVNMKLDDDDYSYSFVELQALARNLDALKSGEKKKLISSASKSTTGAVRSELDGFGFKFVGRQPLKSTRGIASSSHGTSPFVGMAGGSGMGSGREGPIGFGMGGGPGAIGSGKPWNPSAPGSLPMGARRK